MKDGRTRPGVGVGPHAPEEGGAPGSPSGFVIEGGAPLRGVVQLPGDKSISHRALLIAALAQERSRLQNLSPGEDVAATRRLVEEFGAHVSESTGEITIEPDLPHGGRARWVDCGNSGTTMRLGSGFVVHASRTTMFIGDASLSARPMARVLEPLCSMGASAWSIDGHAPIVVQGGTLRGIDFTPEVSSAQVKGAVLLAGLAADGETTVHEQVPTRAHTEELLREAGADLTVEGGLVRVRPGSLMALDLSVPGDPSAAAFWVVAASITPGSELRIEGLYRGPGRDGFLDVLGRMGADFDITERGPTLVDLEVRAAELTGTDISDAAEVASAVDELPAISVAAAFATGTTVIKGAQELRLKESDRISAIRAGLTALGAKVEESPDGLLIEGAGPCGLTGALVDAAGDHRIAMALGVAGCAARGRTKVDGWSSVEISDPGFEEQLVRLRAA